MISTLDIIRSWANIEGNVNTTEELYSWIEDLNKRTYVDIKECSINDNSFWFYDDYNGEILNRKRSFFSIKGMRRFLQRFRQRKVILPVRMGVNFPLILNYLNILIDMK